MVEKSTPASENARQRKQYQPPRVKQYGNIRDITQNLKPNNNADPGVGLKTGA
jgi:hypothetical protein